MNEICIHNGMRPRRDLTCISIPPPFRVCVGGGVCVCVFVNGRTSGAIRPSRMPLSMTKLTALPCSARRGRSDEATTRGGASRISLQRSVVQQHTHTRVSFFISLLVHVNGSMHGSNILYIHLYKQYILIINIMFTTTSLHIEQCK